MKKILPAFLAIACLSGCSVMGPKVPLDLRPGQGAEEDQLHLRALGVNRFQCVKDDQGYYWKFDGATAKLGETLPKKDEDVVAVMRVNGRDNHFTHRDGSFLFSQKIEGIRNKWLI